MKRKLKTSSSKLFFVTFFAAVVIIFLSTAFHRDDRNFSQQDDNFTKKIYPGPTHTSSNNPKIILIYTLEGKPWIKSSESEIYKYLKNCHVQNCVGTYDKSRLEIADAVVFRGSLPFATIHTKQKPLYQRWVFYETEAPKKRHHNNPILANLTITFSNDSDIVIPYGTYEKRKKHLDLKNNFAANKKRFSLWLVTNCLPQLRKSIVYRFSKYMSLDIGGNCIDYWKNIKANKVYCPNKTCIDSYKFYLAFENIFCKDYISEKYWVNAISHGAIPVVLGGGEYSNPNLAIPGSYIRVQDFKSIEKLTEYLKVLDSNDTLYNRFFKWKQRYEYVPTSEEGWPHTSKWICQLCEIINNNTFPNQVVNINKFWNMETRCKSRDEYTKFLLFKEHFPIKSQK